MVRHFLVSFLLSPTPIPTFADRVVGGVKARLESAIEPWEDLDILGILHNEREALRLSTKVFMTALRCAITGMKVRHDLTIHVRSLQLIISTLSRMDPQLQT
jgi:hypothetical protein